MSFWVWFLLLCFAFHLFLEEHFHPKQNSEFAIEKKKVSAILCCLCCSSTGEAFSNALLACIETGLSTPVPAEWISLPVHMNWHRVPPVSL